MKLVQRLDGERRGDETATGGRYTHALHQEVLARFEGELPAWPPPPAYFLV